MKYFSKEDALGLIKNIPIINNGVSYAQQIQDFAKSDRISWAAVLVPPIVIGAILLIVKKSFEYRLEKKKEQKLGGTERAIAGFP